MQKYKIPTQVVLQLAIVIAAFALLYHHTIVKLVSDWSTDDNFSHGFLVPFIAGYMIWHYRERLVQISIQSSNWGYVLLAGGMLAHIVGNIGAELFVQRFSMILSLMGLTVVFLGIQVFRHIFVPLIYLLLMVPIPAIIWNKVAFPLQLFAAKLSGDLITFIGVTVLREGNILHLTNTTLEVVDACSGLRSLMTMMALSALFAYISNLRILGKWLLFVAAFPIAIAVNIFRLTMTSVLAKYIGPDTAQGFLHDMSGFLVFLIALFLLFYSQKILSRFDHFKPIKK